MIDFKKAFYYAFRFTYPSDSMDFVYGEFNYKKAKPTNENLFRYQEFFFNKFNGDYSREIEAILKHPVTLTGSALGLPTTFDSDTPPSWSRLLLWNMLGWEDHKPLWLNIIRSPFSLIKNIVVFLFMLPLNILKIVTELLPAFLSNLCDQAENSYLQENRENLSLLFACLGSFLKVIHFFGRAVTSPAENARFYFSLSVDLFNQGSTGKSVVALLLGISSLLISGTVISAFPQLFANIGMIGVVSMVIGWAAPIKSALGSMTILMAYQEFSRAAGAWWKTVMNNKGPQLGTGNDNPYHESENTELDSLRNDNQLKPNPNLNVNPNVNTNSANPSNSYEQWKDRKDNNQPPASSSIPNTFYATSDGYVIQGPNLNNEKTNIGFGNKNNNNSG